MGVSARVELGLVVTSAVLALELVALGWLFILLGADVLENWQRYTHDRSRSSDAAHVLPREDSPPDKEKEQSLVSSQEHSS